MKPRGSAGAGPEAMATVLDALTEICEPTALTATERASAARLATDHRVTICDSAYAAVAQGRHGRLVTMYRELLAAGRGVNQRQPC